MTVKELAVMYNAPECVVYALDDLGLIDIEHYIDGDTEPVQVHTRKLIKQCDCRENIAPSYVEVLENLIGKVYQNEYSRISNRRVANLYSYEKVMQVYKKTGSDLALILLKEVEA